MKKIIFYLLSICASYISQAQFTGKPIYNIRVERADTLLGNIEVELFPNIAPLHVANWDSIVNVNGYDSTAFHRVVPGFVIQGGDPNSVSGPVSTWGQGNPNQNTVNAEFSEVPHARGILSAARSNNINSASSQFFICTSDAFSLDNNYSVYGEVTSGMDITDLIVNAPVAAGTERPEEKIYMLTTAIGSNDSIPNAPTLVTPIDGITGVNSGTGFSWNSVPEAKLYLFEIASDANFSNIIYSRETKNTFASYTALQEGYSTYYWRVRTNNGGNYSTVNNSRSFQNTLGTPQIISPLDGDSVSIYTKLDWNDVTQSTGYRLIVSRISSFGNPNFIMFDEDLTSSEFNITDGLQLNVRYYWKVVAKNALGEGDYSSVYSFYTNSTELNINEFKVKNTLNIYPNPVTHSINFNSDSFGLLYVYDVKGELVLTSKIVKGGNKINIEKLNKGYFTYNVISENNSRKGNFIKK